MAQRTSSTRSLTARALDRLLARLHPDPAQAPIEYERLRRTLIKFFDWRGVWVPEECADIALDRLARKLEEDVDVLDVRQYTLGIARLVLLEYRREPVHAPIDDEPGVASRPVPAPGEEDDALHECFDRCLAEMPPDGRALVLEYYEGERDVRIANRRRMAAALNLSENALRSRVQRLRDRLEDCVRACTAAREEPRR